jgi:hypothetical protein
MVMRKAWFFLAFLLLSAGFSCKEKSPEEFLRRVDAQIYYPHVHGLKSLSADVETPYIQTMFERVSQGHRELLDRLNQLEIKITYYWQEGRGSRFVITGFPPELKELKDSIKQVFDGTEVLINPYPERVTFSDFLPELSREKDKIIIMGVNKNPMEPFLQYSLTLDRDLRIISKKYYTTGYTSIAFPAYIVKEGQFLLTYLKTDQEMNAGESYSSEVKLEYTKKDGIYLVKTIEYLFVNKSLNKIMVGPVKIIFHNHQVNKRIDPDIFKKPATPSPAQGPDLRPSSSVE